MEYRSRLQWIVMVIIVITVIVLTGFGLFALFKKISGNSSETTSTEQTKAVSLADYNNDSSYVRLVVNGPVVANETHQEMQITVGQTFRNIEQITGYEGQVLKSQSYDNNSPAYSDFLKALSYAGYTNPLKNPSTTDPQGVCSNGKQYIYEVWSDGQLVSELWTTSCGKKSGTTSSSFNVISNLFKKQIPDYDEFSKDVLVRP